MYQCLCCGCYTLPVPPEEAVAYICPVCFWENDVFIKSDDEPSDENHGLTLRQAQQNYIDCGACCLEMKRHTRPPYEYEVQPVPVKFCNLADYLKHGREIEFAYKDRQYSITNNKDGWQFFCDTDGAFVVLCPFREFDTLVEKMAQLEIDGVPIVEIFDGLRYDNLKIL